jgi:hypothetical protein
VNGPWPCLYRLGVGWGHHRPSLPILADIYVVWHVDPLLVSDCCQEMASQASMFPWQQLDSNNGMVLSVRLMLRCYKLS